ncbi:MAG: hypothetical protein NZ932_06455 [Candidatus Bathyarchaeota archaeon]|nr:hypothetical protein [Candidatus Bathyarchaeota archaeon]MDW8040353.1 hypothetical protein [Nitrososphaerota archaeon]
MALAERISRALLSVLDYLNKSISNFKNEDEKAFFSDVWHVAAELEYTLFLLSLIVGNENNTSQTKLNHELKSLPTDQVMLKVKDLVSEAQESIRNGDFMKAYKSAYLARHYVFRVQESLTEKKRETDRGKK